MRILVIGAVAAGTSAAAKARRNDDNAEIVIYEKDPQISYSGCGMPFHLSRIVEDAADLAPRDPAYFKEKYAIDIHTRHKVLEVSRKDKSLKVMNLDTEEVFTDHYDKLVIATGAKTQTPPIDGADLDHVFVLRTFEDMLKLDRFLVEKKPQKAVIIGSGFVGMELTENFHELGMDVTVAELLPQVTPGLDADMADLVEEELTAKGVKVYTDNRIESIAESEVTLADGTTLPADIVILATGVKPEVTLAEAIGLEIGETGAIKVTPTMQTSDPDIYACGDCIEQFHIITGKPFYMSLGSTANKTGRICGDAMTGGNLAFRGVLGTSIFRIFDLTVAQTGLTEKQALAEGFNIEVIHNIKVNRAEYMGGKEMTIKAVGDRESGRLLGVQIIGPEGVDKRVDVFVTALSFGANVSDLFHLDLAYAPPYSTAKDPVMYTGMILEGAIYRDRPLLTSEKLTKLQEEGKKVRILDTRVTESYEAGHIDASESLPHAKIRENAGTPDDDTIVVAYCNRGTTANAAQNILKCRGFTNVYNLSGGYKTYARWHKKRAKD